MMLWIMLGTFKNVWLVHCDLVQAHALSLGYIAWRVGEVPVTL